MMINRKIRDECMEVKLGWTDYHTFVSYFPIFQMPAISPAFGLELWNLAVGPILAFSFICLSDKHTFLLISGGHISNRSIEGFH